MVSVRPPRLGWQYKTGKKTISSVNKLRMKIVFDRCRQSLKQDLTDKSQNFFSSAVIKTPDQTNHQFLEDFIFFFVGQPHRDGPTEGHLGNFFVITPCQQLHISYFPLSESRNSPTPLSTSTFSCQFDTLSSILYSLAAILDVIITSPGSGKRAFSNQKVWGSFREQGGGVYGLLKPINI